MTTHPLAGKPAPYQLLTNIPRLMAAYYTAEPDLSDPTQRVAFGTSGHRGTSTTGSFTEAHIAAVTQAIVEHRTAAGITGPLFLGMDTHALSEAALVTAVEVLAGNGIEMMVQAGLGYTPTPVVSHAILAYNKGRTAGLADGIIITPRTTRPKTAGLNTTRPTAARPTPM